MSHIDTRDLQLRGLADLLLLEQRLRRSATIEALQFTAVNDVGLLVPMDVGLIWLDRVGNRVAAVAGLPEPVRDAPFTVFAQRLGHHLHRNALGGDDRRAPPADCLVSTEDLPAPLAADWPDFLPRQAIWVPLTVPGDGAVLGGMLLARAVPWQDEERRLLARVAEVTAHSLDRLTMRGRRRPARKTHKVAVATILALAAFGALFIPVTWTALAPAEVKSAASTAVRAPLEGVIGEVAIQPNQMVASGDLLLALDDSALRTRLDTARQNLDIAIAEHRQAQQTAMRDSEAASRYAVLSARVAQADAEVGYLQELLDRVTVRADRDGIVIVPNINEMVGKPVRLGERLLTLADPNTVEVEAWLAVENSIPLKEGAGLSLYLNIAPDQVLRGQVRNIDYQAQMSPDGVLAFRMIADLENVEGPPRIGLRGTARIEGDKVPLYFLIFRRPWAAIRPWLGL
jgi:multidrug resistance efflux pump